MKNDVLISPKENIGRKLSDIVLGSDFPDKTAKAKTSVTTRN